MIDESFVCGDDDASAASAADVQTDVSAVVVDTSVAADAAVDAASVAATAAAAEVDVVVMSLLMWLPWHHLSETGTNWDVVAM